MHQRNINITRNDAQSVLPKSLLQDKQFQGFHLRNSSEPITNNQCLLKYDFKQRIDSMFDETRSAILESNNANTKSYLRAAFSECGIDQRYDIIRNTELTEYKDKKRVRNTVQARIEKMFADVSSSEIEDEDCTPVVQQFQVDYIGSSPMLNKVTSLQGLQEPLKNLYFNYRKNKHPTSKPHALLEISSDGLKVQNFLQTEAAKEQLNPFPSIAVWAALKFVCRPQAAVNGKRGLEYAFLPIVVDQKNCEKSCLFRTLDRSDISCAIEKTYDDHSPLFVVIMRQSGTPGNALQCHGFACATSEDAIILAANLYKALVATVSTNQAFSSFKKKKKVKCGNGVGTVCSTTGSSVCEEQDYLYTERKDTEPVTNKTGITTTIPPSRPPRKSKSQCDDESGQFYNASLQISLEPDEIISIGHVNLENEQLIDNIDTADNIENSRHRKIIWDNKCHAPIGSRQSVSSEKNECGDILTKVVIPRRGSILNTSGPLASRYNRCANYYTDKTNNSSRKSVVHSPLGFIELFNELRIHEGLNNIDEILNRIIDVDGMSFDGLKPVYKEFIFKLAVTLTKDELYQRSKSIMQKQKRRKRHIMYNRRGALLSGYRIKRALHISVSKLRMSKYKFGFPFTTRPFPAVKKIQKTKPQSKPKKKLTRQNATPTCQSNDSFVIGFRRRITNGFKYRSNDIYKDKSFYHTRGEISFDRKKGFAITRIQNTSLRPLGLDNLRDRGSSLATLAGKRADGKHDLEAISGYASRSECSCNSELSKYKNLEKCYCSMTKQKKLTTGTAQQSSVSSCSCDTDSCIESEKCYCNSDKKPSIFEQLRQQGFAASESSLSRPDSPVTIRSKNGDLIPGNVKKGKTCLQASKSLEFVHVHKNISRILLDHQHTRIVSGKKDVFIDVLEDQIEKASGTRLKQHSTRSFKGGHSTDRNKIERLSPEIRNSASNGNRASDGEDCHELKNYDDLSIDYIEDAGYNEIPNSWQSKLPENNKVLVVSTRDQKGQVRNSFTPLFNKSVFSSSNLSQKFLGNGSIHETDAISIKKTAEIAALFSDVKLDKKNYNKDMYNSLNPQQDFFWNDRGSVCIKNINLENSLGYFP